MATAPYVLARTMKEAHAFAREELGLTYGHYRIVNSASTVSSVRGSDLYLVPGWERRFDRFAMKGAIRWTRLNVIRYPDGMSVRDLEVAYRYNRLRGNPDGLNPPGVQLTLVDAGEAHSSLVDLVTDGAHQTTESLRQAAEEEIQQAEESAVKRRRRRCKECGTLHFKEDSCPSDPLPGV